MGRLTERLASLSVIGLDTAVFIYHFLRNPKYLPVTRELFSGIELGVCLGVTSTITLMELITQPLIRGRQDIARKYEALLVNFPHLSIIDLNRDVIHRATRLRAEYHLRPPDALQVSACLSHGAVAFITHDPSLERLSDRLEVIILDDLIFGGE
jgi:predicted nucleic acid-binding protein